MLQREPVRAGAFLAGQRAARRAEEPAAEVDQAAAEAANDRSCRTVADLDISSEMDRYRDEH
jgi:hypothetical protein